MANMRHQAMLIVTIVIAGVWTSHCQGQGAIVSAGGPIHRGMGGASTAAPLSAISAMYWNPATISGLEHNELEFGIDLLFTDHRVASSVGGLEGDTEADAGTFPVPNIGWVYQLSNPALTFGLGINSVAGFKTNLPVDPTNPVLAPQPFGLGRVSSEATFMQIAPVLSYAFSEQLSVAAGPIITTAQVGLEPFVFAGRNGDGSYSPGQATTYHWGGGFQTGIYYIPSEDWRWGASFKSPSWMQTFEFSGQDENGLPRQLQTEIDLPMMISLGLGYTKIENWVFALDGRFLDYANADGFGDPAQYNADGSLQGLDWSSVFAVAFGAQRSLGERCALRLGYTFNQNPIQDNESFFNVASPLLYEHMLSVGGSYWLSSKTSLNLGYSHYLRNDRTGPIVLPGFGALPGSSVTNELSASFLSFGLSMQN